MRSSSPHLRARSRRRDVIAWFVLLVITTVVGLGYFLRPRAAAVVTALPSVPLTATPLITILSFDRIVANHDSAHLSQEELRARLSRLKAEGFSTITVAQLADFYSRHQPLPEKSLLLLFEHGYLDSYRLADPILRELGWHAVMGLQTRRQDERDTAFVYWDRLQHMVDSGVWDLVSQGRDADRALVANDANAAKFLYGRLRIGTDQRAETDEEFSKRVERDLQVGLNDIETHISGYRVIGFNYPYSMGRSSGADRALVTSVRERVAAAFQVVFVDDLFGVNDVAASPHRLKRVRVTAAIPVEDLIAQLDASQRPAGRQDVGMKPSTRWIPDAGRVEPSAAGIALQGAPIAQAWLAGSQWDREWVLEADVANVNGEFWLVGVDDISEGEWRFGGNDEALYLQRADAGKVVQTLVRFSPPATTAQSHHLKFIRRGAGVWIEWDGVAVAERPIHLSGHHHDRIGWKSWNRDGTSSVVIGAFSFHDQPYVVRELPEDATAADIQDLVAHAPDIAAIAISWGELDRSGLRTTSTTTDLARILARRYGWDILAHVNASVLPTPEQVSEMTQAALNAAWQGAYVTLSQSANESRVASLDAVKNSMSATDQRFIVAPVVTTSTSGDATHLTIVER